MTIKEYKAIGRAIGENVTYEGDRIDLCNQLYKSISVLQGRKTLTVNGNRRLTWEDLLEAANLPLIYDAPSLRGF